VPSPMIRETDAIRVRNWIDEAVSEGPRLLCGGRREGHLLEPMILDEVRPQIRVSCQELFGPAVCVTRVDSLDEALALANDTPYGLSAAIFTQSLQTALRFAREVDAGNLSTSTGAPSGGRT
jgi:acyl-CoA reductase-like NAD-dependent aldehyde dehydrogenase